MSLRGSVWKERYRKITKITLLRKEFNSLSHYNLVHKFILMPQAMKSPMPKPLWTKSGRRSKSCQLAKCQSKRAKGKSFWRHRRSNEQFILPRWRTSGHLESAELEPTFPKIQRPTCTFWKTILALGSPASHVTVAKVMDVIASPQDCPGQAADAVSAYTQVKMEGASGLLKLPK